MPCWSVLSGGVQFGAVDPRVVRLAAESVGYTVEVSEAGIRLTEPGDIYRASLWIRSDGRLEFAARHPVVLGGQTFDVSMEAGRVACGAALKRLVMVSAVRVAAARAGAVVVGTGASTGRVTLRGRI
jgi:hypothetical protein